MSEHSLKKQNIKLIAIVLLVDAVVYALLTGTKFKLDKDFLDLITMCLENFIVFAIVEFMIFILCDFVSAKIKNSLVFGFLENSMPSYRAFSFYAKKDNRVDERKLNERMDGVDVTTSVAEHQAWYSIYRKHKDNNLALDLNGKFLLYRDLGFLGVIFLISFIAYMIFTSAFVKANYYFLAAILCQTIVCLINARRMAEALVKEIMILEIYSEEKP